MQHQALILGRLPIFSEMVGWIDLKRVSSVELRELRMTKLFIFQEQNQFG